MTKEKKITKVIKKFLDGRTSIYRAADFRFNYTLALSALDEIAKIINEE